MPADQSDRAILLMVGDVVGAPGLRALFAHLPSLIKEYKADLVVVNGENALGGFGIGIDELEVIKNSGASVITTGNHVWERKGAAELLAAEPFLLRPANYPPGLPGSGIAYVQARRFGWVVINLQGRTGLYDIDCPFRTGAELVARARREHPGAPVVIDFHAESPDEKEALAWHLDGQASVVAGTHTHVQTADERILPRGTGYLTDLGMTGPVDSVIGVKTEICVRRALTQIPLKMETAEGQARISGAVFEIDPATGSCLSVQRIARSD